MTSLIYVNVLYVDDIPQSTDPRKVYCRVKKGGNTTFIGKFQIDNFFGGLDLL